MEKVELSSCKCKNRSVTVQPPKRYTVIINKSYACKMIDKYEIKSCLMLNTKSKSNSVSQAFKLGAC